MLLLVVKFIAHSERQQGISRFLECSVFLAFGVSIVFLVDLRTFYQPVRTVFIRKLHNANVLVTGVQTSRTNRCAAT